MNSGPASTPSIPASRLRGERLLRVVECIGVFVLSVVLMNFFYAWSVNRPGDEIGVPEHDSYYHIAMAQMLPEHGLLGKFPWLQYTYFRDKGDDFVSHHWGFHLLLLPFVKAAEWITGNPLDGGRWAMSAVFGVNLLLFHLLLRHAKAPLHWLWIALFLLLPDQFFARHGFVRAIGASFLFMQLLLLCLFNRRWILAGLTLGGYVHLYLGAVMYGPLIVAVYAFSQIVGTREDRSLPWKMVLITAAGWVVGVLTYPYLAGMREFLWMQVFGSGLTPDIQVGQEWKPYTDAWFVVGMAAPLLAVWVLSIMLRLRIGPRLDAKETTLLVLQFGFLLLMFKARRFVEYWPPLCLLSAAYLATPPLRSIIASVAAWWQSREHDVRTVLLSFALVALAFAAAGSLFWIGHRPAAAPLIAEWRTWMAVVLGLLLPALARVWTAGQPGSATDTAATTLLGSAIAGAFFAALIWAALVADFGASALPRGRIAITGAGWAVIAAAFGLLPLAARSLGVAYPALRFSQAVVRTLALLLAAIALPATIFAYGSASLASASRQVRCYYDLRDIREVMGFLKENSRPGDIVFTDDWDIFPVFFYHNRQNHYIVGLDPKFTHHRDPELWDRYVKISRGEVPTTIRLAAHGAGNTTATVGLTDIRDRFHARFVVADRDHRRLADALAAAPDLAEFVYPGASYPGARSADYVVFRIRDVGEKSDLVADVPTTRPSGRSALFLSSVSPVSAEQGWGDLGANRSVDGNALRIRGQRYERGLGTHAPAKLVYDVPGGYEWFEALVGIDDETAKRGSATVSVYLDGHRVYESPLMIGGAEPIVVRIPLGDARQILLQADPTNDGQRFDHVNWADARFTTAPADAARVAGGSRPAAAAPLAKENR